MAPQSSGEGTPSPDQARKDVADLVERVARNADVFTRPDFKGAQVRAEFIDAVFDALGWDVRRRDTMVALVERVLDLHKKLAAATVPADKNLYPRQIAATDEEIDALVYELYGLTEEQIVIVEGRDRSSH